MGESLKRSLRLRRFGCTFALHLARQQLLQRQLRQVFRLFFLLFGEVVDAAVVRLGVGGWLPSRSAHHKNHSKQEKKKKGANNDTKLRNVTHKDNNPKNYGGPPKT